MVQAQQAPQQNSLRDQWRRLSDRTRAAWKIATGAVVVGGSLYAAYSFLTPHIEIEPGIVGSDEDASQTEFIFKNTGHFSIRNAIANCAVLSGRRKFNIEGNVVVGADRPPMAQGFVELAPGKSASRSCGAGVTLVPFPASFDIGLSFDWPFYWWRVTNSPAHFISLQGQDGHIHIQADSN